MNNATSILTAAILMTMSSCGDHNGPGMDKKTDIIVNAKSMEPVLYFKASGNEPGWHIQLTAADNGTFPVIIVLDYGADTLRGVVQKQPIMEATSDGKGRPTVGTNESKYIGKTDGTGNNEDIDISIVSGICTDEAEKQHGAEVRVQVSGQTLRGCGDYID
jgi:uncharacterized membrane protein